MRHLITRLLTILAVLVVLSGCGEKEEAVEILFFSDITKETGLRLIDELENTYPEYDQKFNSKFNAAVYERLVGEIAAHNGDILIVEADMLTPATFDSEGLMPFEISEEHKKEIPKQYSLMDEETGEENIYALPIDSNAALFRNLAIELEKPLVAMVPVYGEHLDLSMKLVMEFSKLE